MRMAHILVRGSREQSSTAYPGPGPGDVNLPPGAAPADTVMMMPPYGGSSHPARTGLPGSLRVVVGRRYGPRRGTAPKPNASATRDRPPDGVDVSARAIIIYIYIYRRTPARLI